MLWGAVCLAAFGLGCRQDMHDQPRFEPFQKNAFFADGRSARPLVEGTVARGELREDDHLYRGMVLGAPAETLPVPVTRDLLHRGRERYDIYCSPCHDRVGTGKGMVVQRGLRRAASLHEQRLRDAPPGYLFDVITNGFGAMASYAAQVPAEDRWAIIAYVRALQLSQHASLGDVPDDEREALGEAGS
jgi:mono/diheme cytochrome c family protein